jgi:hypothetical protein
MLEWTNVRRQDVDMIVRATFPEYRGRKIRVAAAEGVTLHDLNWSGGTRSQYRGASLSGQSLGNADRYNQLAPWDSRQIEGQRLPLVPGVVVVEHSMFCGKDTGLRIYVHPADMPRLLAAPLAS